MHTKGNLGNKDSLKDKRLGGERSNEPKALKTSTSERLGQRGREAQKKSEKGEKDIVGSNFGRKDEGKHRGTATKNKLLFITYPMHHIFRLQPMLVARHPHKSKTNRSYNTRKERMECDYCELVFMLSIECDVKL